MAIDPPQVNEDIFAKHGVFRGYWDDILTTSNEACTRVRHEVKHIPTGFPMNGETAGCLKRLYALMLNAFDRKDLGVAEYMLLFTNRLHQVYEEYPEKYHLVESARLVITYTYFVEGDQIQNARDYLAEHFEHLIKATK